jgi:hypothetical protein
MDLPVRTKVGAAAPALAQQGLLAALFDEHAPLGARRFWGCVAAVCALALLVRWPMLDRSLWLDEAYSAWFSALPLPELWTKVPLYETHPPFYYTLLKGWRLLAGSSEVALRAPSVLASVATVLLMALAGRVARLGPLAERVGLLAALLLALNAGNVQFAQQARPYALQAMTAAVAIFCSFMLLRPGQAQAGRQDWWWAGGLAACAGLTLWLHDTGIFIGLGIWTGLACALPMLPDGQRRTRLALALAAGLGALLIWSPFVPMFLRQGEGMSRLAFWVTFTPSELPAAWVLPAGGKPLKGPAAALGLAGIVCLWRRHRPLACHLLLLLLVAPLAMAAYSYFVKPIFLARLFEWLAPLVMATVALGVFALWPPLRKPAACIVVAASLFATWKYYGRVTEDWRGMLATLAARAEPGDLIVAVPNEVQPPVQYYLGHTQLAGAIVYLPQPFPAPGLERRYVGNLGAPAVAAPDVERLRAMLPHYRRVWLMQRLPRLYDPQHSVEAALRPAYRRAAVINGIGATVTLYEASRGGPR